jgi:hypothetical protein
MTNLFDREPKAQTANVRESLVGKSLTEAQCDIAMGVAGIIDRHIHKTGSFREPLTDYAHAFARSEKFDAMKGETIIRDVYAAQYGRTMNTTREALRELEDVNRQLENMLDRIVEANSASVVNAYETRIEKLERDKLILHDRITKSVPPKGRLDDCIELSLKFLSSLWNILKNRDFAMRQAVLRLVFAETLRYSQNGVYKTPKFSFPFKCLGEFSGSKSEMVL